MRSTFLATSCLLMLAASSLWGCRLQEGRDGDPVGVDLVLEPQQLEIEVPQPECFEEGEHREGLPPVLLSGEWPPEFHDMSYQPPPHHNRCDRGLAGKTVAPSGF